MEPTMPKHEDRHAYFASGQFVHDELLRRCARFVSTAQRLWRKNEDPSFVIMWPSEPIKDADGATIEDEVLAEFPREDTQSKLRKLVDMTKAYGLLVIEKTPNALIIIFESHHGTHSWVSPVEQHGDVKVLGRAVEENNVRHHGLLWSPSRGSA